MKSGPKKYYDPWYLKPHTVVYHKVDRVFYEVFGHSNDTPGHYMMHLITESGTLVTWRNALVKRTDVEIIAPTHPVYIKWAARRLQDRLEGLDRT